MHIIIGILALFTGLLIGLLAGLARANGPRLELAGVQARLDEVQATGLATIHERDQARAEVTTLRAALSEHETLVRLARQETQTMAVRVNEWEETKAKFLETTRASVLTTAQELSSKLLEDHKRETAAAKAESEKQVVATTEGLRTQMGQLSDGVSQLKGQIGEKAVILDTVRQGPVITLKLVWPILCARSASSKAAIFCCNQASRARTQIGGFARTPSCFCQEIRRSSSIRRHRSIFSISQGPRARRPKSWRVNSLRHA